LTQAAPAPLNRLRKLWQERRPTFGAIATIPSLQTVQIPLALGFDWSLFQRGIAASFEGIKR
jgi:4-hydroxy-2-oxoheptanedioate aldolase